MKKLATESKKINTQISKQTAEQKKLTRIQEEYNSTLKKSNQIQTSYAGDLQKVNAQMEVLKKNQKLLTAEGKQTSAQYIRNKTALKELSAEYRKLEKEKLQDIQVSKTLAKLDKKENLTLKEQKQLFSALNIQYNKLVTSEGKASKGTLTLQKRMDKLNQSILKSEKAVRMHQRNVGNYPKTMGKVGTAFSAVGLAVTGAFFAMQRIFGAMTKYIDMAKDQIEAEKKLEVVMQQRMGSTDAQVQSILNLTSAQQQLGVVGDEVQIAGAQQLATFLNQEESLQQLIPAMNNLIVQQKGMNGTQQDAVTIANLFGKVMDGQTSALTRVGISLTDAQKEAIKFGTETEKAAILAQVITDNVGNMNEEFAQTDTGKLQQAKNVLGDLGEEIGMKILPIVADLAQFLVRLAIGIKEIGTKLLKLEPVQKLFESLKEVFQDYAKILVLTNNTADASEKRYKTLATVVSGIAKVFTLLTNQLKKKIEAFIWLSEVIGKVSKFTKDATEKTREFVNENSKLIASKTAEYFEKTKTAVSGFVTKLKEGAFESQTLNKATTPLRVGLEKVGEVVNYLKEQFQSFLTILQPFIEKISTAFAPLLDNVTKLMTSVGLLNQTLGATSATGALGQDGAFDFLNILDKYKNQLTDIQTINNDIDIFSDANQNITSASNSLDIFAQKQAQINADISAQELALRRKYKDDAETIEIELLDFKQQKQIELLQFIDDNNLTKHQIEQDLKYLDISQDLHQKKYDTLYNDYQDFILKKELENENFILSLEKDGATEVEIEFQKLTAKKEMLTEYLDFLNQNANDQNEIERLQLANQLLDIDNQLSDFATEMQDKTPEDAIIENMLGLSDENIEQIKGQLTDLLSNYYDFLANKKNAEIEALQSKRELLEEEQNLELEKINKRRENLDVENSLRNKDFENTALLTESLIRESEKRIKAKEEEDKKLLELQKKKEAELKVLQKKQIYTQFALDNASAISSIVKYAMANPLNSITGGLAGIAQISLMTAPVIANFLRAKAMVKGLKDGEVLINGKGSETSDSIPAMLSRNESVINARGSKRAPNLLRGLNKNASASVLMQLLTMDLGREILHEHNITVDAGSYELKQQNKILLKNNQEVKQNNVYLQELLNETRNKADFVSIPKGYKKITRYGETDYIYE